MKFHTVQKKLKPKCKSGYNSSLLLTNCWDLTPKKKLTVQQTSTSTFLKLLSLIILISHPISDFQTKKRNYPAPMKHISLHRDSKLKTSGDRSKLKKVANIVLINTYLYIYIYILYLCKTLYSHTNIRQNRTNHCA